MSPASSDQMISRVADRFSGDRAYEDYELVEATAALPHRELRNTVSISQAAPNARLSFHLGHKLRLKMSGLR
jgi:hypothetical protein